MDFKARHIGKRTKLPTHDWGELIIESADFTPASDGDLIIEFGNVDPSKELLLRIHSECVFSETFGSTLCDCGEQLQMTMNTLKENGEGVLVYLRFDGRGAGLAAKVEATDLEVRGIDTYHSRQKIGVKPEGRDFLDIGTYLFNRGFRKVCCLTNNPKKAEGLKNAGLEVRTRPLVVDNPSEEIKSLYRTKHEKFGHLIPESKRK